MIRAAIIDGHPAMRAGMAAIFARTDDVIVVAEASGEPHEVEHTLYRTAPDVVIVEHATRGLDGVELARLIKAHPPAPRVVIHADWVDATLVATAMLAGADALVDSRAVPGEFVAAVRTAAGGRPLFPEVDLGSREDLARRVPTQDEPILRMHFAAVAPREIARALKLDARTLRARMTSMIESLRGTGAATPSPAASVG
jgi:two-component system, NarL family, response regulator DevR